MRWLPPDEAAALLTYPRDRELVERRAVNRERFPGLADGWVRLDGPGGTQMVDAAIDAMADWMRSGRTANEGGAFPHSRASEEIVDAARASVARLLGGDPRGVAFGPSMTSLTMARLGRRRAHAAPRRRDRLHAARPRRQRAPVADRRRARRRAACASPSPSAGTLELPAAAVETVLSERTRWVAVTAASNAVGSVPDLPGIVAAARRVGARVYVDAVHAAPHRPLDVARARLRRARLLGLQVVRAAHRRAVRAAGAARGARARTSCARRPDSAPDRWELGTLPFEALAGVRAAADYVGSVGWDAVRAHEDALLAAALDGLGALEHVTLHGGARDRTPTLMFTVDGHEPRAVAAALAEREIAVWNGNYYAWELERHLGLAPHGAVRAGFVHYNEPGDARAARRGGGRPRRGQ